MKIGMKKGSNWYFIITQAAAGSIWNTLKGLALGSERFKDEIEAALHRKVCPGKAGRPSKKTEECNGNFQSDNHLAGSTIERYSWGGTYLPKLSAQ
jgi:hypothetical protein